MDVQLTPEQEAFIQQAVKNGRLSRAEDAGEEAFSLWERRERSREEILAAFDEAEEDLASGRYTEYTDDTLPQLADELRREARALRKERRA